MSKRKGAGEGIKIDGLGAAAELLNALDPEHRRKLLENLAAVDPSITEKIQKRMIVFEELLKLEDQELQLLLREVPNPTLVLAMRRVTPKWEAMVYRNLSGMAGKLLKEEVATQGPKKVSDIVAAQDVILKIALKLEAEGKIKAFAFRK